MSVGFWTEPAFSRVQVAAIVILAPVGAQVIRWVLGW